MPLKPQRTPEGKWVVYDCATGQRTERWPVDARGMIASGDYTPFASDEIVEDAAAVTGPDATAAIPAADPMPHVTKANAENAALSPTGTPLVIAPSDSVQPAQPIQLPTGRTPGGRRSGR